MKKADKLKKDLEAFNVLSSDVSNFKIKFFEKNGILHSQCSEVNSVSGRKICQLAGDSSLTLTKPLHILNNLDKICPRCVNTLSFNKSNKSMLSLLINDFTLLLKVNKYLDDALEQMNCNEAYFTYHITTAEDALDSVYNLCVKKHVPAYSNYDKDAELNTSLKMSYQVKLFVSLYEKLIERKNDLLKQHKLYLLSDENEKVFLTKIAARILPTPSLSSKHNKIIKFREEVLKLREELVQNSNWALFSIHPTSYPTSEAKTIFFYLSKYETNQKNLFHAPQIYLDYWLSTFGNSQILSSVRFTEPVGSLILENVAGIYSPDTAGANSSLRNVLAAAKII